MATQFYSRTLPAPFFVNVNGGTWSTLGVGEGSGAAATIPPAYVEGDDTVYLVQIVLQRTSSAANIRINLDTFISGSGGQAGPDFIPFVESRGLIRLSYAGGSRVFDIAESAIDDDAEPYAWQFPGSENAAWMRGLLNALVADSTTPITIDLLVPDGTIIMRATLGNPQGVRKRVGEAEGLSVGASVGNPKATIHGEASGVTVRGSVGRPRGYKPSVAAQGFTVEASQRQVAGFRRQFAYAAFLHIEEFGVRDRTRSGGSVWEWNNRDVMPPFPVGDTTSITVLRLRSDQFRVTGTSNTLAGLGADFIRHGDLILYSPSAGEFHITPDVGRFDSQGRIRLAGDEWDAWWTAFSADAANELTVEWFFHGLEPVVSVGRPLGVKDPTRYGLPLALAQEAVTSQPHVLAHGSALAAEQVAGRPGVSTTRAMRPIAQEAMVSRPHAYSHAEFILQESAVGRPRGYIPAVAAQAITQVAAVGRPLPYAHGAGVSAEQVVGRPGVSTTRAVRAVAQESTTGRPHAFAHAEFILEESAVGRPIARVKRAVQALTQDQAVGRPAAILFGVPGSTTAGETVTESHDFGRYTLIRPDANSTWQFNSNLTLPTPIMTASASPIVQAHVRANQVRFIQTGGQNPGFSDAFNARGRVILTRVGAQSFTITGPNFDHLGRMDPSGLDGYSEWWTAFRGGGTLSELLVTWELDAAGFIPFLAAESVVGRPEGRTQIVGEAMPLAQVSATGRPHAFAHAEFILEESAVGRPGVSTTRAAMPLAQVSATGRPHAYAHAEFILEESAVGRPRGYIPAVAAESISQVAAVDMPDGVKKRFAVGRGFAVNASLGRPRGYIPAVAAESISQVAAVGRPRGRTSRATLPISQVAAVGRPQPYAHGAGVSSEQAVGRPRGYIPAVAAMPVAQVSATGRPHAFAHAEFILEESAVGRPGVSTSRGARPLAQAAATGRPHVLAHGAGIALEAAIGRPRSYIPAVAAMPLAAEQAAGRPRGVTQARTRPAVGETVTGRPGISTSRAMRPIALEAAVSRPHTPRHAVAIAAEQVTGRPGVSTTRGVRGIAAELAGTMPIGERRRIAYGMPLAAEQVAGRPGISTTRGVRAIVAEQVTRRPAAVLFGAGRPLAQVHGSSRPRGYLPSVAATGLAAEQATGLPHGERVRTTPTIPIVELLSTGRPAYYRQIFGTEIGMELDVGTPRGFFPYRNPRREVRVEVQTREGVYTTAARSSTWSVDTVR